MPIFNISTESCLGYTHYGDVTVNGKGTVELTDEQVQTLITLIRENGGETDIDALNLKESCPEIYDVLYEAFSDVAWKAAYNHWVIEGYDCNYYDTPLGESIAICEESYGFEYDGQKEKEVEIEEDDLSGTHAADVMGMDHDSMFKTLVLSGDKTGHIVCCIPVDEELDLKKVAKASGNKKVEMIHVKELLPLTGYMRGGCSPVGMKKKFPTYIDETAILFDRIAVSAGMRGEQVILNPEALAEYLEAELVGLTREEG